MRIERLRQNTIRDDKGQKKRNGSKTKYCSRHCKLDHKANDDKRQSHKRRQDTISEYGEKRRYEDNKDTTKNTWERLKPHKNRTEKRSDAKMRDDKRRDDKRDRVRESTARQRDSQPGRQTGGHTAYVALSGGIRKRQLLYNSCCTAMRQDLSVAMRL